MAYLHRSPLRPDDLGVEEGLPETTGTEHGETLLLLPRPLVHLGEEPLVVAQTAQHGNAVAVRKVMEHGEEVDVPIKPRGDVNPVYRHPVLYLVSLLLEELTNVVILVLPRVQVVPFRLPLHVDIQLRTRLHSHAQLLLIFFISSSLMSLRTSSMPPET